MKVSIRPLQKEDAKTSVKWRNIPELWVHTTFKATREITLEDEQNWIDKVTNDPTSARFAIIVDKVYVGNIYLTNMANDNGEYHIFIGEKDYWGKGVARAASVCILDYAKDIKLNTVSLLVKKQNEGAYHLYSKLGFTETGEKDGEFTKMILNLRDWRGDPRATMK